MLRLKRLLARFAFLVVAIALAPAAFSPAAHAGVLVLYDYRPADSFGKLGKAYAIMLRNLLGHFTTSVTLGLGPRSICLPSHNFRRSGSRRSRSAVGSCASMGIPPGQESVLWRLA